MPLVPQMVLMDDPIQDVRMTLTSDQFLNEYGGRLAAGTVVMTDERTARRWRQKHIAVDSAETDKTLLEQKQAYLQALQDEIEQLGTGGIAPINYDLTPGRQVPMSAVATKPQAVKRRASKPRAPRRSAPALPTVGDE